ncbi:hypothetical protein [Nocardioides sp.]|uniref:hypothetical protein n=1 Tax=Nocardioides sp. TaxID=35761 RepID=UPI002BC85EA7|nr:hypothetical protein [Nocardioides sp.]HXH77579.1 hypothetical protein [Nocardioides sp.]
MSELDHVRAIADAVLYEGYLLYPYRASSSKNQSRWQFGVLGPPRASAASFAEEPGLSFQCLLAPSSGMATVRPHLRFLQLQVRSVERCADGDFVPVTEMVVDGLSVLSWEEAVECEVALSPYDLDSRPVRMAVEIPGGEEVEPVVNASGAEVGRIVRRRLPLQADVTVGAEDDDGFTRLSVAVTNTHPDEVHGKDDAIRSSMIGTHVLLAADGVDFVSLLEPPEAAAGAAGRCTQRRCFPVLVGPVGSSDVVMGSPIILYDHPEIAEESAGALFDSTEIDEILTLRVMTMTDAEKAEARATDPRAAAIIDRCDQMSDATLRDLHGVLRDPHRVETPMVDVVAGAQFDTGDVPWWDPAADESVRPDTDSVVIEGVSVARGSLVRVHPSRRADAQDLFFADQVARVTAVLSDVDGSTHVALVLVDDPAADLHEEAGRFFYFAPDELEPLDQAREESHP